MLKSNSNSNSSPDSIADQWNPFFHQTTPLYWPIRPAYQAFFDNRSQENQESWPTLDQYNQFLNEGGFACKNENDKSISFVPQGTHCNSFEDEYEPRIFCTGEVQTRLNNWHDFFQVMVWKTFPKTKSLLNQIHYHAGAERHKKQIKQRGKLENFVTLFDECGAIVLSNDKEALDLVKDFNWNTLFVKNKFQFGKTIDCVVFGHAMYEKALKPYIGMTSHCLLLHVETDYFNLPTEKKMNRIDNMLTTYIKNIDDLNTKILTPLPILGVPDWHQNQTESFYADQSYFRKGRKNK